MAEPTVAEQAPPQDAPAEEAPATESEGTESELPETEERRVPAAGGQIDILLDTVVQIAVRLGEATMPARELIQLGPGSVVPLDKQAGAPVDLYLRGIRFATGKLVVVGEQLGVQVLEIFSPDQAETQPAAPSQ